MLGHLRSGATPTTVTDAKGDPLQKVQTPNSATMALEPIYIYIYNHPLTRNYYENNSLRIIFRNNFEAILYPRNLRERRTFSRNYA